MPTKPARRVVLEESSDEDEYYDNDEVEDPKLEKVSAESSEEEESEEEEEEEYEEGEEYEEEDSEGEEYSDDEQEQWAGDEENGHHLDTGVEPVIVEEEDEDEEEPEQWAGDEADLEQSREGAIAGRSGPRSKRMSKTAMPQQSNREINPDFQDVQNTGKWGTVSRREFYVVLGLAVAVIIAIVVVVAVLVTGNDDSPSDPPPRPPPPTDSPTQAPTRAPITDVATSLRDAIGNLSSISGTLADLPEDEAFYVALHEDSTKPANVRAMSWILYADPSEPGPSHPHLAERYALATLFYATGGEDWIDKSHWITEASICTWAGLFCDVQERLVELDLSSNGLKNELPNEIALLQHVRAFSVRHNQLTGPVPALAFHDIPELSILYLDNNMFTGELDNVLSEGVLSVLFTQENNFTKGFFPIGFCDGNFLALDKAGLDCDVTRCLCCNPTEHCL